MACGGSSKILIFSPTVCRAVGDSAVYLLELRDLRSFVCWAVDDSAAVFPYYFPFGKLNLR